MTATILIGVVAAFVIAACLWIVILKIHPSD